MAFSRCFFFFFFNDTATTEIYTLSLHDALPICAQCSTKVSLMNPRGPSSPASRSCTLQPSLTHGTIREGDRKSTRLNSSHDQISYAVFCLKKKKKQAYLCTERTNPRIRRLCPPS